MIKSSPQTDHRRWHRLALPRRAEARVEDVRPIADTLCLFQGKERLRADCPEPSPFPHRPVCARGSGPCQGPQRGRRRSAT